VISVPLKETDGNIAAVHLDRIQMAALGAIPVPVDGLARHESTGL
jgi:hypothetical protein